ncbi:MAG: flagellar basal body-associated FliL family protein [Pseudomonadota bacterium]|nr:flagellar basal body-associated FliL family protein [Alphaproteobacteria bacterium]MCS5596228.1 flagellar basal body-associated FliL family protein [Alphaproteobacteria bacterium]MEC7703328.1 flagellar basal body-associated FliL family protein [Pseudomonadota bacterium]MEC9236942.1 flagellar basal body-associated FliL family protein [Pseudomonadota bacterium]|tara:strand:- start:5289 stop:5774 length:486 start_codon:yes stop_codon:yes gene_type:complete
MKKVLIGVVGILLLGGGAGGGYLFLKKPAEASLTEEGAAKEAKHAKKKKGHGDEAIEFVQLDPLILPIVDRNGLSQVVSIVVALEVDSKEDAEKVKMLQPKIKDAFISEMYGVIHNPAGLQEGNIVKVRILKERLGKIGRKVLGDDVVNDVLLQVVQQRPA